VEGYTTAWWVIAGSGVLGSIALFRLLRMIRLGLIRWLGAAVALTFFCVPAPVPNHDGQWAPAFVVFIFEAFFQTEGQPVMSLRILGLSLAAVSIVTVLTYNLIRRGRASRRASRQSTRSDAKSVADSVSESGAEVS